MTCPYCTNDNDTMMTVVIPKKTVAAMEQYRDKLAREIPTVVYCEICGKTFRWFSSEKNQ